MFNINREKSTVGKPPRGASNFSRARSRGQKEYPPMHIRTLTVAAVTLALFGTACATGNDEPETVETPSEAKQEPQQAEAPPTAERERKSRHGKSGKFGKFGKRGGPEAHLLGAALRHVDLSDEQRAKIEALRTDVKGDREARHEARAASHAKRIAAIRSGNVADLQVDSAEIQKKAEEKASKMVSAMNQLHSILDSGQRQVLVDTLKAKSAERAKRWEERKAKRPEGKSGKRKGHHRGFGRMLENLELTEEQQAKIDAAREADRGSPEDRKAKHEARKKQMDELLTAFVGDDFDAQKLDLATRIAERMTTMSEHHAKRYEVLLPILTDEQRTQLADRMQQRHERMKDGKWRRHGDRPDYGRDLDTMDPEVIEEVEQPELF